MTTHAPKVVRQSNRVYGPAYKFTCTCGTRSPLMSRQGAELAKDRHTWEFHLEDA